MVSGSALALLCPTIIFTSAKAEFIDQKVMDKIYDQMRQLNKYARDIMVKYDVHSCTDVSGFGLLGHGYEMAQGSNVTIHFMSVEIPYHKEAFEISSEDMIKLQDQVHEAAKDILSIGFWNRFCDDVDCQWCALRKSLDEKVFREGLF